MPVPSADKSKTNGEAPQASKAPQRFQDVWRKRPLTRLRGLGGFWLIVLGSLAVGWFVPPVYKLTTGPVVVTRYVRSYGETKATVGPGISGWISTKKISKHALHAIVAAEDGKFYEHHGLYFGAIYQSYELNRKRRSYARGASTI